ncbi:MAG: hypothetical protein WC683_04985 [bacterium]
MAKSVEVRVEGLEEVQQQLTVDNVAKGIKKNFKGEFLKLFREIMESSPVRTGQYRRGWAYDISKIEAYGVTHWEGTITNNVAYARNLIFGIGRPLRYPGRYIYPDEERGIAHDVRRILHEWQQNLGGRLRGED